MSRPRKQEVDYFPHYCDHGKVLFILENRFGNDGYAVFYKIEELLAKTNGHCYDCSTPESWEYLLSKMNTPEDQVVAIIDKLVSMGTIDRELWDRRLIWMQTFVDSIADAYSRRKVDLPSKPDNPPQTAPLTREDVDTKPVKPVICQHLSAKESKVNKSKVKESISRKPKTPLPEDFKISPAVYQWAKNKGHTRLDEHLESFKAKCRANGYQYIDWDSAFMEAVRSDWAKLKPAGGNGNGGIRTARSDPRDKTLQSREDAEIAAIIAKREAAKQSARDHTGGNAATDDAPDFSNAGLTE